MQTQTHPPQTYQPQPATPTPPNIAAVIARYDAHAAAMHLAGQYVAIEQARIAARIFEAEDFTADAAAARLAQAGAMMERIEARAAQGGPL